MANKADNVTEQEFADAKAGEHAPGPDGLGPVVSNQQKIGGEPGSAAHVESAGQREDLTAPLAGQVGGNAEAGPGGPVPAGAPAGVAGSPAATADRAMAAELAEDDEYLKDMPDHVRRSFEKLIDRRIQPLKDALAKMQGTQPAVNPEILKPYENPAIARRRAAAAAQT